VAAPARWWAGAAGVCRFVTIQPRQGEGFPPSHLQMDGAAPQERRPTKPEQLLRFFMAAENISATPM